MHFVILVGINITYLLTYLLIAAKRQTAGIKFTHRPKIRFFAPICTDSRQTWQGRRMDWHVGPLGCAKLSLSQRRGWECGPQNMKKNPPFW